VVPAFRQLTFRAGILHAARFAPDGQTIAYSAAFDGDPSRIYSTRPTFTETRTLDLPPAKLLAISSSNELAFLRDPIFATMLAQSGTLVRAGLEAGAARDLGIGWKISPSVSIDSGASFAMATIDGPGTITHIWLTTPPNNWRTLVLRAYWDHAPEPARTTRRSRAPANVPCADRRARKPRTRRGSA